MNSKLSKRLLLSAIMVFCFLNIAAQNINTNPYWEGEIKLTNGSLKKGYIMVPNSPKENFIAFKPSLSGKKETVKRKLIESIVVISENGSYYLYENVPISLTIKGKKPIGRSLLLVKGKNDYVTVYVESQVYKVDKKEGEIILLYRYIQGMDLPLFTYYIRKRGKPHANMFAMTGEGILGLNGRLKRGAKYHLVEDKALIKKINNGELKHGDIDEIIDIYMDTTDGM